MACAAALLGGAAPASAQTAATTALAADATQRGVISLLFGGAGGSPVQFFERVGDELEPLGTAQSAANVVTVFKEATTWSCARLVRRFEARATRPDGSRAFGAFNVRTPSCAQRFTLKAPRRVAPGALIRVRVQDRWRIGDIDTKLCATPPGAERRCRTLSFPRAVTALTRSFRAKDRGRWRIELRVRSRRLRDTVTVGGGRITRESPPPTVLATGDSTMQGIDNFLAEVLGEQATVRSDVRIGTGITRGSYWLGHSESQVKRYRQPVTVVSLGGALDAFAIVVPGGARVECCGEPWIAAYSARVRTIMRTYLRGGRGRVFWLTPPLPRDATRAKVNAAVTAGILRGAQGLNGVTVARADQFFSPGGAYTDVIRYRGRDVRVRAGDGIHLSVSGTSIAAQILAPEIRRALAELEPAR